MLFCVFAWTSAGITPTQAQLCETEECCNREFNQNTWPHAKCIGKIAAITNNVERCTQVSNEYQDFCYLELATTAIQIDLCERIEGVFAHAECVGKIAAITKNVELCSEGDRTFQANCYNHLISSAENLDCELIPKEKVSDRANCSYKFCYSEECCEINPGQRGIRKCTSLVRAREACANVEKGEKMYECITENARNERNEENCEAIPDYSQREDCIAAVKEEIRKRGFRIVERMSTAYMINLDDFPIFEIGTLFTLLFLLLFLGVKRKIKRELIESPERKINLFNWNHFINFGLLYIILSRIIAPIALAIFLFIVAWAPSDADPEMSVLGLFYVIALSRPLDSLVLYKIIPLVKFKWLLYIGADMTIIGLMFLLTLTGNKRSWDLTKFYRFISSIVIVSSLTILLWVLWAFL